MRPLLLSSDVQDDNAALSVDLANPDVHADDGISLPRDTIAFERTKFLWQAVCYERIGFRNYADSHRRFRVDICFSADFRDLFEVRGETRAKRGKVSALITKAGVEFHYEGLDNLKRKTELRFSPEPVQLETNRATFEFDLAPKNADHSSSRFSAKIEISRIAWIFRKPSGPGGATSARRRAISRPSRARTTFSTKSAADRHLISTC